MLGPDEEVFDAQLSIEERDDGYWALLNLLMILPFAEGKDLYWRELKQTKISPLLFLVTFLCSVFQWRFS